MYNYKSQCTYLVVLQAASFTRQYFQEISQHLVWLTTYADCCTYKTFAPSRTSQDNIQNDVNTKHKHSTLANFKPQDDGRIIIEWYCHSVALMIIRGRLPYMASAKTWIWICQRWYATMLMFNEKCIQGLRTFSIEYHAF